MSRRKLEYDNERKKTCIEILLTFKMKTLNESFFYNPFKQNIYSLAGMLWGIFLLKEKTYENHKSNNTFTSLLDEINLIIKYTFAFVVIDICIY